MGQKHLSALKLVLHRGNSSVSLAAINVTRMIHCLALCRVRTSSGMFLNRGEDDIIEKIEARIAKYTAVPKENGEGLQVLNYKVLMHFCLICFSHSVCHNAAEYIVTQAQLQCDRM